MQKMTHSEKRFTVRFMIAMLVFLFLIAVQTFAIELFALPTSMVVFFALLPIAPLVWAFFIYRAHFQALDEYMSRLTSEAFLWVIGLVCFVSFAYGMLVFKLDLPQISFAYILPVVFGCHGLILQLLIWADNREK
ncbi:hypothetical protein [Thalassotalea sp. PLHSN55]|uniref:hypothetical protein n=1 Tax=Thalassotalea sp. PLHSN55 TaxID=3435888 RepID=UPI003F84C051